MKPLLGLCSLLVLGVASQAVTETYNYTPNANIPDGNPSGISSVQTPATSIVSLSQVIVSVSISGTLDANQKAFNGDIYAYLTHGTGISILLNRVGRTAQTGAASAGYSDNGFLNVTFSDSAPVANDIHLYQNVTTPTAGSPLSGGTWLPDARTTDPNLVLATDPRQSSSFLSTFNLLDAHGSWTLFVADLSTGEEHTLNAWTLQLTGAIPEPGSVALLGVGAALLGGSRRRRR